MGSTRPRIDLDLWQAYTDSDDAIECRAGAVIGLPAVFVTASLCVLNSLRSPARIQSCGNRSQQDACAVRKSGDIYCWGDGAVGQLGRDPSIKLLDCFSGEGNYCSSTPMLVTFSNINKPNVKVSCGNQFMMAWDDSGSVYGLGADYYYGQLGDGNAADTYIPVSISPSWLNQ